LKECVRYDEHELVFVDDNKFGSYSCMRMKRKLI
jgi:hypothetical protein